MGMYDNLGDIQVKCFSKNWWNTSEGAPYGMGGELRYFNEGDKVPYVTPWYNFGKNFIVYDYRFSDGPYYEHAASVIKDGKFVGNFDINDHIFDDFDFSLVLDDYASVLNITCKDDFTEICKEDIFATNSYDKECTRIEYDLMINNGLDMTKDFWNALRDCNDNDIKRILKEKEFKKSRLHEKYRKPFIDKWYDYHKTETLCWTEEIACAYEELKSNYNDETFYQVTEYFKSRGMDYNKEKKRYEEYLRKFGPEFF